VYKFNKNIVYLLFTPRIKTMKSTPQAADEKKDWEIAYEGKFDVIKQKLMETPSLANKKLLNERQLLHWVCAGGHEEIVEYLLNEIKVPVDEPDDSGWTPLIIACSAGYVNIVHLLLSHNADVNKLTTNGQSSLHYAASRDRIEICEMLLSNNANVNVQDTTSMASPLHRAASKGNTKIVEMLIKNGCHVNSENIEGNTPLHLACEEERVETAELLVLHAASLTLQNKMKKTPMDLSPSYLKRRLLGE